MGLVSVRNTILYRMTYMMNIELEGLFPLRSGQGRHVMVLELLSGIRDEDVESAEGLHVRIDDLLAADFGLEIESDEVERAGALSLLSNVGLDVLRIFLLRGQVPDRAVCTLESEQDSNRPTDL